MPVLRLIRPVMALGALALVGSLVGSLGGCVAAPQPLPPGTVLLSAQCYAGFYQCVLPQAGPAGTPCSCPGLGAPSYGTIR